MATLSPVQIAANAMSVGLSASAAVVATAIALAESSGRSDAVGDVSLENATWGPSIGLWQVRSIKSETGKGTTRDAQNLTAPQFNAMSMKAISNGGQNWSAWSTFTSGAYRQYLPQAQQAVNTVAATPNWQNTLLNSSTGTNAGGTVGETVPGDKGQGPFAGAADAVTSVAGSLTTLVSFDFWWRLLRVVIGVAMIAFGVVLLNRDLVGPAALAAAA